VSEVDPVTLTMEVVCSSETSVHSSTTWCRNSKEDPQLIFKPIFRSPSGRDIWKHDCKFMFINLKEFIL